MAVMCPPLKAFKKKINKEYIYCGSQVTVAKRITKITKLCIYSGCQGTATKSIKNNNKREYIYCGSPLTATKRITKIIDKYVSIVVVM